MPARCVVGAGMLREQRCRCRGQAAPAAGGREPRRRWQCRGEPWCVQAGCRQDAGRLLALPWMVLLVWQLWVPQEVGGSGSVRGHCPTSPVPAGVAGSCARCWSGGAPAGAGTGATARGRLTEGLRPVAVSSLTVKGGRGPQAGRGRRPLGAGYPFSVWNRGCNGNEYDFKSKDQSP